MTRINLMLPLLQLTHNTNNPEIITDALRLSYPEMQISNIFWVPSGNKDENGQEQYECVVRVAQVGVNFDNVVDVMIKAEQYEAVINRLKNDLFNMANKYDSVLTERNGYLAKIEKYREEARDSMDEGSVSIKIDQKVKRNVSIIEEDASHRQLNNAISELTRENLRLKDKLSYCQAHIEFLMSGGEEKENVKKEGSK